MVSKDDVMKALRTCFDPEIGISVVEMGLIYGVTVKGDKVDVRMTLTTPGCPLHNIIAQDAHSKVAAITGVKEVNVNIVWDPPWTPDRMSPEARKQLGYN